MAEPNTGTAYDVGGENKRVIPFTIQQREWLSKFHNIGILFFSTITTLRLITDHQTDMVAGCFENFAIYSYDSDSMEIDDGENYLRPNNVDQYTSGRWILRAKFDGGNIELKFYNLRVDFPIEGGETYLYIDKSNGRLYRWSNFVGEYIGMSVNYSLDSGMLGGQLPVYYKDVMQVNSLPLDNQLTTVIYELLQQDGDKAPYTLWAWDGLQWNGVGGSTSETDPLFQQWLLTADIVESVTSTDNHIVVDNTDPKNPSLSFQLVDNENLLTDDELEVVQATSGTNTGDQVGDGVTITGAGTIADPFVATNTSLWQHKDDEVLSGCFIPSTGELQEIHDVLLASGVLLHNLYWSSSEVDAANAYYFKMSTNEVLSDAKDAPLIFPLIVRKFTTTDVHELLESTTCSFLHIGSFSPATAKIYKIVDNGTDFTYWQAIESTSSTPVIFSGDYALVGTTSQAVGEGENNTNEIALADPLSYAYALKNTIEVVINNSQIIEPKNDKFIETADIIDIDKYLKKDTTLQSSDTPISTSLFSFWKIGIGRVKIAWLDLINLLGQTFQRITASGDASVTNYFSNVNSAFTGFKLISTTPDATETEVSITATNGTVYGQKYIFPSPIGVSVISAGVWPIDYYRKVSNTANESYFGLDYFMVNPSTLAETPLFSVESPEVNDTTYIERPTSSTQPQFSVNPAHHIGVRVKLRTTRPTATTGSYIVGDGRGVWLKSPLTPRHSQLRGLDWLGSGHTGTANKLFGSDENGVGKEYAISDFGGGKRLVVQNSKGSNLVFLGADIKPIVNGTKLCCCTSTNSYIYTIDSIGGVTLTATLATNGASFVKYLPAIDKFHILSLTGDSIYVINGTTNVLESSITISTATANTRLVFASNGDYEYYSVSSLRLNQRNIITGVITENAAIDYATIYGLCAFTHENVNYIALSMQDKVRIYSESLVYISQVVLNDHYYGTLRYFSGKLYLSANIYGAGTAGERIYIIDLANINSPTSVKKQISCGKTLFFNDYFIHETEMSGQRGLNTILNLRNYDMEIVDSLPIYIPTYGIYSDEGLLYDSVNDNIIWIIPNGTNQFYGKIIIIKVK